MIDDTARAAASETDRRAAGWAPIYLPPCARADISGRLGILRGNMPWWTRDNLKRPAEPRARLRRTVDWLGDPARVADALSRRRAGAADGTRTGHDGGAAARLRALPRPAGRG